VGEFPATSLAALAAIGVEGGLALDARSPARRPITSARLLPVRTSVRRMARSRLPARVSGTTPRSRLTSSAEYPRATDWTLRGRSTASQGFETTRRIRIRNLQKEDKQAIRAPTVVGEGVRPERPMPWTQASTSAGLTRSGVLPHSAKKGHSMRLYDSTVRREPERLPFSTRKAYRAWSQAEGSPLVMAGSGCWFIAGPSGAKWLPT
jgi:hypothetical protein